MADEATALIERFTAACHADDRVVAAFLGGSHARGAVDPYPSGHERVMLTRLERLEPCRG